MSDRVTGENYELIHGDCLAVMRDMPDNVIDSVVTDPPYGLGKTPDMTEVLQHWLNDDEYDTGPGFMAKDWDVVPGARYWREMYRVAKPGATLLAFGGTRTADLLSIAIRLGGWERFDEIDYLYDPDGAPPPFTGNLSWVYAQGFPKGRNIFKDVESQIINAIEEQGYEFTGWGDE